jgi:hypothetical protein
MCLSSGWESNGHNHDPARVEKPSRLGAVELGWGELLRFRQVVDGIDESA